MKPSSKKLGQAIQLFLLKHGHQVEALASEMGITSEGLSNLIHGRRCFKNETLQRLANTSIMTNGGLGLNKLKALRAMDEYTMDELLIVLVEVVKSGQIDQVSLETQAQVKRELFNPDFPAAMADKRGVLLQLLKAELTLSS